MTRLLRSPFAQMVMATVLFAAMGACVKLASAHAGTAWVVSMRGGVGAVIMALIAWASATTLATGVPMLHLRRGVAGVLALSMWFYSMSHLPLATAVTLNYMSSVWMAVMLVAQSLWRGEHMVDRRVLWAIAMGFAGVVMVLHPTIDRDQWVAGLVGLASGILSAVAYIQVTALGKAGEPEVRVVFYFSLTGTTMGLLMGLWPAATPASAAASAAVLPEAASWPVSTWLYLLGVGSFATVAQLLMTRAYARGPMLVMANLQYLGIVHASLLGVWLFNERLRWDAVLGMALITASGIWSTRLRQR